METIVKGDTEIKVEDARKITAYLFKLLRDKKHRRKNMYYLIQSRKQN